MEYFCVKFGDRFFKYRAEKQTDKQTNGGKNPTPRLSSTWLKRGHANITTQVFYNNHLKWLSLTSLCS